MELTGRITDIKTNYLTKKFELTVAINEPEKLTRGYEELKGSDLLDIMVTRHRNKRSLDANAYFHLLVGRLAESLGISKPRCKNLMIGRYGQPVMVSDEREAIIKTNIPESRMMENETVHCVPCGFKFEKGIEVVYYRVMRGSSTYDTAEMRHLIDGVISECADQKVETMPPAELERILNLWKA